MGRLYWMPFCPADWLADTAPLHPLTRGLWIDTLCVLWPSGTKTLTADQWARSLRCTPSEFDVFLADVILHGVAGVITSNDDVTPIVTLMSRRMLREATKREQTRNRVVRLRGNASVTHNVTPEYASCNAVELDTRLRITDQTKKEKRGKESEKGKAKLPDTDWLKALQIDPAYTGLDVPTSIAKCRVWCETNKQTFSRRRIVNWLNNQEKPLTTSPTLPPRTARNLATLPQDDNT